MEAMSFIFEIYKNIHFRYCCRLMKNRHDAEDLFQDAWLKTAKSIQNYDASKPFKTWLFCITTNLYKDQYRKAKRWFNRFTLFRYTEEEQETQADLSSYCSIEDKMEDHELKVKLMECLSLLDDKYRIPIILFYFKEISYEDIVEILGIPMGTLKTRLHAGKKKLNQKIGGFFR
jgi:RNA polymerase sigma factor, sigma-70 family